MKRILLFCVVAIFAATAMAEVITPEQAQEKAQDFIQNRGATGRLPRRAPGKATKQLTLTGQVDGLYVFNVTGNGGFVIVSNDDCTRPVLGFSDRGNIDINNIPSNMRAWLAGYADEIAWAKKQPAQKAKSKAKAPRRIGTHSTTAIEPLITTEWSQSTPYNNLCPEYATGHKSVTGCVATAMAQVMNYHKWPQAATATIPGYTSRNIVLDELPATTFDWDNMIPDYKTSSYTDAQATAVATLMQYCGWSVQMEYGSSSSALTIDVAEALKNYFDYNSTTQFASRSYYTYAKWTDLIYHELANNRPVVYGGQSSGGGHAFVCDGYKYEQNTDFFHINWGWSGKSDDYFVLSALDPDEQGIGGSTSKDGYNYGQDAVIGIQPSTGTGTVADITPNDVNLTTNSVSLNRDKAAIGDEVDITLNITNNSTDDYDGTIYVGCSNALLVGGSFNIPAGETRDCVLTYTAEMTGTFDLLIYIPNTYGTYSTNGFVWATLVVKEEANPRPKDLQVEIINDNSVSVSWNGDPDAQSYDLRYMQGKAPDDPNNDFEDSTFGSWTTIDADGDGYGWELFSESTSYLNSIPGKGHGRNNSNDMASSGSYSNVTGNALTPDNYLVSPLVNLGGSISFWVCANAENYYSEHFGIAVSTSGNTDPADFTTIVEWTMEEGETWKQYTVDLSAFAGQKGYLAIRHFDCTDMFMLSVDDIVIDQPDDGSWTIIRNIADNSYTLTGLDVETPYSLGVRANYSTEEHSVWVSSEFITFSEICEISLELADSEGDGWNGAAIKVTDVLSGTTLGTLTNTSKAGAGEKQTYYVTVPHNRDIQFQWVSGEYDYECSYVVYDADGYEIFSGSGAMTKAITYHVNCGFPAPRNVAVTPMPNSATLTWTGNNKAMSYNVRHKLPDIYQVQFFDDFEEGLDNWTIYTEGESPVTNGWHRTIPKNGMDFDAHSGSYAAVSWSWSNASYNANNWLVTPQVSFGKTLKFWVRINSSFPDSYEVLLSTTGNATADFTVTLQEMATAPTNGEWNEVVIDLSDYAGQLGYIAIHHVSYDCNYLLIDDFGIYNVEVSEWVNTSTTETSIVLTGLEPTTTYEYQLQTVYADGISNWTESAYFTTPSHEDAPHTLAATDVTHNSATLSWVGYQDSYNVKLTVPGHLKDNPTITQVGYDITTTSQLTEYQFDLSGFSGTGSIIIRHYNVSDQYWLIIDDITLTNAGGNTVMTEDFENGFPGTWFNYDADGDGNNWDIWQNFTDKNGDAICNGLSCTASASFINEVGALHPDNWLVIPNVELGGRLSLLARGLDPDYSDEVFGVFVSTEPDFFIPTSSTTIENVTNPYTITDLEPETTYEVQVQGNTTDGTTDWTESVVFTTSGIITLANADDNNGILQDNNGMTCAVLLADRVLYADERWNTICLPFDVTLADSPLAGATARKLTEATVSGTMLYVTFGEAVDVLRAGTPYIIKWTSGNDIENPIFTNVEIKYCFNDYDNGEVGEGNVCFVGNYCPMEFGSYDSNRCLTLTGNRLRYVKDGTILGAQQAFFKVGGDAADVNRITSFSLNFGDDMATGIISADDEGLNDNGLWYTIDGRAYSEKPASKGIYINNGKKHVVK